MQNSLFALCSLFLVHKEYPHQQFLTLLLQTRHTSIIPNISIHTLICRDEYVRCITAGLLSPQAVFQIIQVSCCLYAVNVIMTLCTLMNDQSHQFHFEFCGSCSWYSFLSELINIKNNGYFSLSLL